MSHRLSFFSLALASAALCTWSGCNLAPHYEPPKLDTPAQYRETASAEAGVAWNTAQPADTATRGAWWEIYGDSQLSTLETQVQASNQSLAAAEANFRAARAAVGIARGALFPKITADPSFTRARSSRNFGSAAASQSAPGIVDEYSLPFDASYEVDLWGRVRNTVAASRANAQASAADLATARLSLEAELAQDYFQMRALDAQRQILSETVDSYRKSLEETQALFRAGIDSQEDVARATTQLDTTVAQATDLGVSRSAYEHAIAVLVGKAPANFSLEATPLNAHPPAVPVGVPSGLLERRPDVAAAERRAAAANAQIGVARAAYFPALTLGASGGWESNSFAKWFEWPSRFWSLGPQLAATLFDGGAIHAQTEQARAQFDAASANYRQTVLTAFQSVEDNLAALRILDQEAHEQQTAVASARNLLDLANTRFRTGIDSYLNVITAQTSFLSNRQADVQIQLRQMMASIALVKALGGSWTASDLPTLAKN